MIIKMQDEKTISVPDDSIVSEINGSYHFQKPTAEWVGDVVNTYFIIPVRNVLYIRLENNTKGYEGPADMTIS